MEQVQQNKLKNVFVIGALCVVAYFAVYVARNVLGTVAPKLYEFGYTEEYVGSLSSMFLIFYAVGQLINGLLGDRIKAVYMISVGLLMAGLMNFIFPYVIDNRVVAIASYGISGFFLSMIYGPMTKLVSENVESKIATRICVAYGFSSYFGSPVAGIFAAVMIWEGSFSVSGIMLAVMAVIVFSVFVNYEKRKIISYKKPQKTEKGKGGVKLLIKRDIIRFSFVSMLTGIVRTSVVFWLPTYLNQRLNFSSETSSLLFTVATTVISVMAFITVFIYEKMGSSVTKTLILMFASSAVFFLGAYFVQNSIINIIFLVLAIMASNGSATILWSMYCPSLHDTGMVSGATGFLDFLSYTAAAISNVLFASAATTIGWGNLVLVWFAIMVVGIIISIPFKKVKQIA